MVTVAYGQVKTAPPQGPPPKNLTKKADGHFTANNDPSNPEKFEVYTVKTGDTLSLIAAQILKNMKLWPQLWEQNEHIINPHWIYPNDKILIKPITQITEATPPPVPEPTPPPPTPEPVAPPPRPMVPPVSRVQPPEPKPVNTFDLPPRRSAPEIKYTDLYCSGFVRKTNVPEDLLVTGKYESLGGALAVKDDYIFFSKGAEDGIRAGMIYQVVRPTRKIERIGQSNSERNLGTHYLDVGQIRVVMAHPDFSMARIVNSCEPVEIGDVLTPFVELNVPVPPRPRPFSPFMTASGAMRGSIVMTRNVLANFGSVFRASGRIAGTGKSEFRAVENGIATDGGIVYIDLGQSSGVKPGDLFIVYRPLEVDSELYNVPRESKRLTTQKTAIGEIVILKVEEGVSTALVTYSAHGLSAGDSIERR